MANDKPPQEVSMTMAEIDKLRRKREELRHRCDDAGERLYRAKVEYETASRIYNPLAEEYAAAYRACQAAEDAHCTHCDPTAKDADDAEE